MRPATTGNRGEGMKSKSRTRFFGKTKDGEEAGTDKAERISIQDIGI